MMTVYYRPSYKALVTVTTEAYGTTNKSITMPWYIYTPTHDGQYSREEVTAEFLPPQLQGKEFPEADAYFLVSINCCGVKKHTADIYYTTKPSTPMGNPVSEEDEKKQNHTFTISNIRTYRPTKSRSELSYQAVSIGTALNPNKQRQKSQSVGGTFYTCPNH